MGVHARSFPAGADFLAQRLTGQVANGDLARANFAGDYKPKVLRSESIGNEDYYVLELTAVDRGVTYQKVMYWLTRNLRGRSRRSSTLSNRLLKNAVMRNLKPCRARCAPRGW